MPVTKKQKTLAVDDEEDMWRKNESRREDAAFELSRALHLKQVNGESEFMIKEKDAELERASLFKRLRYVEESKRRVAI